MQNRQNKLLKYIIEEHIRTAGPVGSSLLVDKHFNDISSATIRNEMAEMEKQGLIVQPHISAGRVPTEAGYKFYLENLIKSGKITEVPGFKNMSNLKDIAKRIAEISKEAVVVGFSKDDVYYTGISNVFSQPEFHKYDLVYNFSSVIDHLDEVVSQIYNEVGNDVEVRIGSDNPFGADCGLVITKSKNKMIGIIGPMRMDYRSNINLLKYAKTLI
ncbi:hypothetical protein KKD19_01445 [Patescibacteria group bacterium]|nr:hypothetical protein [Patescibacteria group bacterium]MBU4511897.1 hypothetical protein [Patescibacteria group bacterium]MCG2692864.1 hypothetical protein [Candidatus Parcubacteria bacterium]